jgi:hypothetical protein
MQVLSEGQRLNHNLYGMGEVIASDPDRTSIEFDEHGTKLFVTSLMKAELIGEAPAKKAKVRRKRRAKVTAAAPTPNPSNVTVATPKQGALRRAAKIRAVPMQRATRRAPARRRGARQ